MENNIIVTMPSKNLRAIGREALKGKWKDAVIASLIFIVAISVPTLLLQTLFAGEKGSFAASVYTTLVDGAFTYGYTLYVVTLFRKGEYSNGQLFSGFELFLKTLWLYVLMGIKIIAWMLLFIIPGFVAAFRYSQAFILLVDHPDWSASQCIKESCRLMNGNKGKYFCLMFSFFGWAILAAIPTSILTQFIPETYTTVGQQLIFSLLTLVAGAGLLWLTPYMDVTMVGFYEILVGNMKEPSREAVIEGAGTYTEVEPQTATPAAEAAAEPQAAPEAAPAAETAPESAEAQAADTTEIPSNKED